MADGGFGKFFLESLEVTAGFLYRLGHASARLATRARPQRIPIEAMIVMLGGIVEDRALPGLLDYFFKTHLLEFTAFDQVVEIGDVGGMMLAVMELQGFLRNMRRERVESIGQIRQFKGH